MASGEKRNEERGGIGDVKRERDQSFGNISRKAASAISALVAVGEKSMAKTMPILVGKCIE